MEEAADEHRSDKLQSSSSAVAITTAIKQRALRSVLIWGLGVIPQMHGAFSFLLLSGGWKGACVFLR